MAKSNHTKPRKKGGALKILLVILVCFKYKNDEDYHFLQLKKD